MALGHSPKIVTDGLVCYYDMGNPQKSWKGKPSTNFVTALMTWGGDGTDQTAFTKGGVVITDAALNYNGLRTILWSPGISLNCYFQSSGIVGGTATTSTVWTFSCYVRREDRQPITSMNVYMYYPTSDGASAGTITDAGDGWYRISRTRTGVDSYISLAGFTGFVANTKYYLSGAMLTKDDIPVGAMDGNTTRSTTQAIIDLTNTNTITANNLTYTSNGTFSFNGSTNFISTTNTGMIHGTANFSYSCWVNFAALPGLGTIFENGFYTNGILIRFQSNVISIYAQYSSSTYNNSFSFVPTLNVWYHLVITRVGNNLLLYSNGVLLSTIAFGTSIDIIPSNNLMYIGMSQHSAGQCFNGLIGNVAVYNRDLSALEVQQNFNTHRGRYGV
jgi:hypothetical protein